MALSLGSLKQRGWGLPSWGLGVREPISMKENPKFARSLYISPFLSNPAARPTGFLNVIPKSSRSSPFVPGEYIHLIIVRQRGMYLQNFSRFIVILWIFSGWKRKSIGLINLYILYKSNQLSLFVCSVFVQNQYGLDGFRGAGRLSIRFNFLNFIGLRNVIEIDSFIDWSGVVK